MTRGPWRVTLQQRAQDLPVCLLSKIDVPVPCVGVRLTRTGHGSRMTVYAVWTSAALDEIHPARDLAGPWSEVVIAAGGLAFVDSDDTLSRVYHALKWSLPEGAALCVAPVADLPKAKGLAPGTNRWLRARVGSSPTGTWQA